jgi:hypothetical protein
MSSNMPQHDPSGRELPEPVVERNLGTDPSAGYEQRDVNIRDVLSLAVAVVAGSAIVMWALYGLRDNWEETAKSEDPRLSPYANLEQIPPAPRLQSTPNRDYAQFAAEQEQQLNSYGWVDRKDEIVRIPIDRAMDLILEKGLPAPTGPPDQEQAPPGSPEGQSENGAQDQPPPGEPPQNGTPEEERRPLRSRPAGGDVPLEAPQDRPAPENR